MRLPESFRTVAVLAAVLACLLPAAGCGGSKAKKKGGLTIAERIAKAQEEKTPESRARELAKVARSQARSGDNTGAAKTLSEARSLLTPKPPKKAPPQEPAAEPAPETGPGDAPADAAAPAAEGDAAPKEGDAAPAATDAPADAPAPDEPAEPAPPAEPEVRIDPTLAGPVLVDIGSVYALAGERSTAKDVLAQARKLLNGIDDKIVKAGMLAEAGGIYGAKTAGLSDASTARKVLAEAARTANEIEERFRPESLAAVAMGYVTAGLAKDAAATVAELEKLARGAEERPKVEGLAVAATVRGQTGDKEAAQALVAEAGEAAKAIERSENRAYALLSVARATSAIGDRKGAISLLKAAEKAAQKVGDPEAQKTALEKVRVLQAEVEKKK
jgi:hypothetical protein